ncbi:hypothetical protein [Streptomyces sp. V3I7]|uniref:hypothetical protein n=1 Tax=Streptomyces sp. V3I7 TaxID=3042278 RepID=UPI002788A018|nr:hypothetical protein [Streptomyces sp. V3I7]MDQ0994202.1 hypothetical protein [Streptomyces sp. V3I7]
MKHRRARKPAPMCRRAGTTGRQVLKAQALVVGLLALALFVREIPSLVREVRIRRMTVSGFRARRRYP